MFDIKVVAVLGAGAMGNGITQVTAQAGYQVVMYDIYDAALEKGMNTIKKSLDKLVSKSKITADAAEALLGRIKTTTSLEDAVKDADLIIEAVPEILELKQDVFKRVDAACKPNAIIGSNTSTMPITQLAASVSRPENFCGIHFMNPVPVMAGIELIPGRLTAPEVMAEAVKYVENINHEVIMAVDYAGFIVSRLLDVVQNEAAKCVMDGNTPQDIDKAMKLCCNWPIGPCSLSDMVGIDVVVHGLETIEKDLGPAYKPAPLLLQMVRAGELGRKSGKGYYTYNK
ncbi:MAG: 3-hydroxyacyl-CoA dehydrogenase family protein [Methylocystaceae bacterium]